MSLSEKLKSMVTEGKFTSTDAKINTALDNARGVAEGILEREEGYLALGYQGRKNLRAMIFYIGVTFKPAANVISELLTEKSRGRAKPAQPMKRVDVSPKGEPPQNEGCADCGSPKTAAPKVKPVEPEPDAPQLSAAKGSTDVLRYFENDIEKMKAFAAAENISLGKASAAEGIAKKIFDWLQS